MELIVEICQARELEIEKKNLISYWILYHLHFCVVSSNIHLDNLYINKMIWMMRVVPVTIKKFVFF